MNAPDPLADFFVKTPRRPAGLSGRGGLHGNVDLILEQLRIAATLDADGDWHLDSDVGPFLLVAEDGGDLVLIQKIGAAEGSLEENASGMNFLLRMNFEARGAGFAMIEGDEDDELFVLTARLRGPEVSRETVEAMLGDAMRISRRLDEVMEQPAVPRQAGADGADRGATIEGYAVTDESDAVADVTRADTDETPARTDEMLADTEETPAVTNQTAAVTTQTAPADWYPDPKGEARLRYWDGSVWTDHTAI